MTWYPSRIYPNAIKTTANASATSHTVGVPDSLVVGDLLIVFVYFQSGGVTVTFPADYTVAYSVGRVHVYYKRSNGAETQHTLTLSTSRRMVAQAIAISGIKTNPVVNLTGTADNSTSVTSITANGVANDGLNGLVMYMHAAAASTTFTIDQNLVKTIVQGGSAASLSMAISVLDFEGAGGGLSPNVTATSAVATSMNGFTITFDSNNLSSEYIGSAPGTSGALAEIVGAKTARADVRQYDLQYDYWINKIGSYSSPLATVTPVNRTYYLAMYKTNLGANAGASATQHSPSTLVGYSRVVKPNANSSSLGSATLFSNHLIETPIIWSSNINNSTVIRMSRQDIKNVVIASGSHSSVAGPVNDANNVSCYSFTTSGLTANAHVNCEFYIQTGVGQYGYGQISSNTTTNIFVSVSSWVGNVPSGAGTYQINSYFYSFSLVNSDANTTNNYLVLNNPTNVLKWYKDALTTGATPPGTYAATGSLSKEYMYMWGYGERNVAPETPGTIAGDTFYPTANTILNDVISFKFSFYDLNGAYGDSSFLGVNRGDYYNKYRIQVRNFSTQSVVWDSGIQSTTSTERTNAASIVNYPYAGNPITNNTSYEWRVQVADSFDLFSSWSAWTKFTLKREGSVSPEYPTSYTNPGQQIYSMTPNFQGKWTHPLSLSMSKVIVLISNNQTFTENSGSSLYTWVSNEITLPSLVTNNNSFNVLWSNITWTGSSGAPSLATLSSGQTYYYQFKGIDETGVSMSNWSSVGSFKTNSAPGIANTLRNNLVDANVSPVTSVVGTSSVVLNFKADDSDNVFPTNTPVGKIKIVNGAWNQIYDASFQSAGGYLSTYAAVFNPSTAGIPYGLVTWTAYLYDGYLYSGNTSNINNASGASGYFRYTALGSITLTSPAVYNPSTYNKTSYAPSLTFQWNSPSGRSLSKINVYFYASLNGSMNPTAAHSIENLSYPLASGQTSTVTWAQLGFPDLQPNSDYWYKIEGIDEDNNASTTTQVIKIKTNASPSIPSGPEPANNSAWTDLPVLSVSTISDLDDGPGKTNPNTLVAKFKIVRPNASVVTDLTGTWNGSKFVYQTTSSDLNAYGTYQWYATAYDGIYYADTKKTLATADYNATPYTFVYTKGGTVTNITPSAYTSQNSTSLTPTFTGTWNSDAGYSMAKFTVEISLTNSFTSPIYTNANTPYTLPSAIAPGSNFSITWAHLGFSGNLNSNTYYYYRVRGTDTNNTNSSYVTIGSPGFKTNAGPATPIPQALNSIVTSYPALDVIVTDTDTATGSLSVVYEINQIEPVPGTISNLSGTLINASTGLFRFSTTSTQIPAYGLYSWRATSYDGILYSGDTSNINQATYSSLRTFRYSAISSITLGNLPYPVSGINVAPPKPVFNGQWNSPANRNLNSVELEIYNSTGGSLLYAQTKNINVSAGSSFTFSWSLNDLSSGSYQYRMRGTDQDGLVSNWTSKTSFVVNTAPIAPINVTPASGNITTLDVTVAGTFQDTNTVDGDKLKEVNIQIYNVINVDGTDVNYLIKTENYTASLTESNSGNISRIFTSDLFGKNQRYRVAVRTADSFSVYGPYSSLPGTTFVWVPSSDKNLVKDAQAKALIADPKEIILSDCKGIILNSAPITKNITAAGTIINSTERSQSISAYGFVQVPYAISANAFIAVPGQSNRLIKYPGSSDWSNLAGWKVADAEKTDGTVFVGANYAVPYQFTVTGSFIVSAIGVAYNSFIPSYSGPSGGGTAIVLLRRYEQDGWKILYGHNITTEQLRQSSKTTQYGQTPTWLMVKLTSTIVLEEGDVCSIDIIQTGLGANYLVTPNDIGQDGIVGNVLNCILVTNYSPSSIDIRPWMLPNWLINNVQERTQLIMTSSPNEYIETINTSVDCPIIFDPASSILLKISQLMIINGGLTMQPQDGRTHKIWFAEGADIILNSTINCQGREKTQYALLKNPIQGSNTVLTLDRNPSGWETDDEIYIQDGILGTRRVRARIQTINNNVLTLQSSINLNNAAGTYVVNLSRTSEIRSLKADSNIAMFDNASIQWRQFALVDFAGNPVFNPGPYTTVYIKNMVFETGINTSIGMELDPNHYVENLTIIADEIASLGTGYAPETALRLNGNWSHVGEIILIDSGSIYPSEDLNINLIVINPHFVYPRASIMMSSETTLTAQIKMPFISKNVSVISCFEGNTEQIILNNCEFFYLTDIPTNGIINIEPESVLYGLEINDSKSNYPWVALRAGAVLANATINNSINTGRSMLISDQPILAQVSDPMNPAIPSSLIAKTTGETWDASGYAGNSSVSTKYDLRNSDGSTQILTDVPGGTGSTRYFKAVVGKTFVQELSRHPMLSQERILLNVYVKGSGSLILLMNSSISFLPVVKTVQNFNSGNNWATITMDMYANQDGVAILYASTSTQCWVDQITRIV